MLSSSHAVLFNNASSLKHEFINQRITPFMFFGQRELLIPDLFKIIGNRKYENFYDPFSGSGSISFAAMQKQFANTYHINDSDPAFKFVWQIIRDSPGIFIEDYTKYVKGYLNLPETERSGYYKNLLEEFNKKPKAYKNLEAIFIFLINFSKNNIPTFDKEFNLTTESDPKIDLEQEKDALANFIKNTFYLSKLLNRNDVNFTSGDFIFCLETAKIGDFVLLDPPYPTQSKDVYFKIKNEEELQNAIRAIFDKLNMKNVDFMILYGATTVSLKNQFDEERYNLHHLVRLSTSKIYGDGLEHIYVSRNFHITSDMLPNTVAFYHTYFDRGVEMSDKKYKEVLRELQRKRDGLLARDGVASQTTILQSKI